MNKETYEALKMLVGNLEATFDREELKKYIGIKYVKQVNDWIDEVAKEYEEEIEEICPICQEEKSVAHECQNCGKMVCQDCYSATGENCCECEELK